MNNEFTNIRDFKIMYLGTMIAETMQLELISFNFIENNNSNNNLKLIKEINMFLYNLLVSKYGGITNFKILQTSISIYLEINQIIYDNFDNNKKIDNKLNIYINNVTDYLKNENNRLKINIDKNIDIDFFLLNSANFLIKKGMKDEYYSLIYLSVPFALKISDKKLLIKTLQ